MTLQLGRRDRRRVDTAVRILQDTLTDRLKSVTVAGDAATRPSVAFCASLVFCVVVDEVTAEVLDLCARMTGSWRWRLLRVPTPWLFDLPYLASAADVFPLEMLDLKDRHQVVHGQDCFREVSIDRGHLRIEVEEQLRGKMLHLWESFVSIHGARRPLYRLMTDSFTGFELLLRGMLVLEEAKAPLEAHAVIGEVETRFGVDLAALRRIAKLRSGRHGRLSRSELHSLFHAYLGEVRSLVRLVDAL